jgi:hypothetical protein
VSLLLAEDRLLLLGEQVDLLKGAGLVVHLGDEGSLAEVFAVLVEALVVDKGVDVGEDLLSGQAH